MPEGASERLYLDDRSLGLEFRSAEHRLDAQQIISFASQFDPQLFHLDEVAAPDTWPRALPGNAQAHLSAAMA